MFIWGRTERCWALLLVSIVILIGSTCGEGVTKASASAPEQNIANATVSHLQCPVRDWREMHGESVQHPVCLETRWGKGRESQLAHRHPGQDPALTVSAVATASPTSSSASPDDATEQELDTDSPLDNANFLSFEDWKKQNLAKVGQSAENVGGNRRVTAGGKEDRRRPTGINNALDSLGDDAEIELDFGGFGAEAPETAKPTPWGTEAHNNEGFGVNTADGVAATSASPQGVPHAGVSRRKDAGTTCKERFNYASFDCAATVLKTNPECKGSSSVLIENKDSYMLNECRANNKFLILELCDDILVDTVVLANYEFFSSIFRTFRVSVSDRYPAKPDQWKELGVFEARNTREVQAFAVENPLIWARYLKIEFLTHYGNEFYCPISLIRVHGTTMMEEFKHDEVGRSEDDIAEESLESGEVVVEVEAEHEPNSTITGQKVMPEPAGEIVGKGPTNEACPLYPTEIEKVLLEGHLGLNDTCSVDDRPVAAAARFNSSTGAAQVLPGAGNVNATASDDTLSSQHTLDGHSRGVDDSQKGIEHVRTHTMPSSTITTDAGTAEHNATSATESKHTAITKDEHSASPETTRFTPTQPPSSNPTTQESFFKSVNKRLQMLESNSTLSLLYIEEQSRILRDAFNKVEKRQLAKTSTFLENLNTTVLNELKQFREQYDQVWKSVAWELEHQRVQYHQEIHSLSTQLGVLADELVFQKRVSVIQSVMVLFCFALVLFSRGAVSSYIEFPIVQNMVSRSYSLRSSSPIFGSPSASPGSTRPTSSYRTNGGHRRNLSEDGPPSPTIAYSPPTPTSEPTSPLDVEEKLEQLSPESIQDSPLPAPLYRAQSSPPVLSGCNGEVEDDEVPSSPT